jgi:hypothetical protein
MRAKPQSTIPTHAHDAKPDIPDAGHWTVTVGPDETIVIAENIPMSLVQIKNHGPGTVGF